jgi:hypothetical protein
MARPSYLGRCEGGRYFMQIRLGKPSAVLYGGAHSARVIKDGRFRRGAETVDRVLRAGSRAARDHRFSGL